MSKSTLNKVLIISLLIIWSVVGYQLISSFFGKNEINFNLPPMAVENLDFKTENKDVFDLPDISRDPFLGKRTIPKKEASLNISHQRRLEVKKPWPSIEYYGYVRGENSSSHLVLLKINANLERIRKGHQINGLYIKEIYKDSILIVFENEKRIFFKK